MKKILLLLACGLLGSLWAGEVFYTVNVENIYGSFGKEKVFGRLLPTSKVEVLEEKNGVLKVQIEGYSKEGVNNAVYFVQEKRILVAGLSKKHPFEFTTLASSKDSKGNTWNKVSFVAYITKGKLEKKVETLYKSAQKLFTDNCSMCHPAHPTHEFTANQWPSMIKAMASRTALTKDQIFLITEFLQKHAKDMKKGDKHE